MSGISEKAQDAIDAIEDGRFIRAVNAASALTRRVGSANQELADRARVELLLAAEVALFGTLYYEPGDHIDKAVRRLAKIADS